jgi:hypothetical protein
MDTITFWAAVNAATAKIVSEKAAGQRPWDPSGDCVWLVSTEAQRDFGGRENVAVLCRIKRGAEQVLMLGRPYRFATAQDAEPGGAISENLRQQRESLLIRNVAINENGDGNFQNTRRTGVKMPKHLQEAQ